VLVVVGGGLLSGFLVGGWGGVDLGWVGRGGRVLGLVGYPAGGTAHGDWVAQMNRRGEKYRVFGLGWWGCMEGVVAFLEARGNQIGQERKRSHKVVKTNRRDKHKGSKDEREVGQKQPMSYPRTTAKKRWKKQRGVN